PKYRADISQRWREATLAAAETALPATMPRARLRGKDGVARVFDITARRMGEQYLVVFSNVTAREEAAQALQAAKESAEHAALARAQFLATMSHEIRTPLNGIIGMTELAIATATEDEQRRYLQVARSSADALLGLLNAVLDFSKIEAGRLHPESVAFDARESIGEVLALMRPQAEKKGLALHAHLDPRLPERIVSDPLRMRQVLTNLLANAIKFTETGEIQLEVEVEDREAQELGLHFRVKDTGIGIAEDRLQSIFSSFVQADGSITRRYGGTGLGLAICARLAEILGGSVWAESKLGLGSTFHCTLRVRAAGAEAPRSPA
ncbi:MAG: diguanylate cyclase, partial [Burkholderiales bacterium]